MGVCWQEENPEGSMFFMQLPPTMPLLKTSATTDGQDQTTSTPKSGGSSTMQKSCTINELPAGFMGKMLVYRSGAVKLTLGDTLYDVSAVHNIEPASRSFLFKYFKICVVAYISNIKSVNRR